MKSLKDAMILAGLVAAILVSASSIAIQTSPIQIHRTGPTLGPLKPNLDSQSRVVALPTVMCPWKATWDLETGRVRMLYDGETAPDHGDLETHARRFLAENRVLFGLDAAEQLKSSTPLSHGLGETIRFQQTYRGLRVVPGDLAVSRNREGRIFLVSSGYRPGLDLDPTPAVSSEQARQLARGYEKGGEPGQPELIVWAPSRPFHLAWQVDVSVRTDRLDRVILDAGGGRLLARGNRNSFAADPTANVYLGNSVDSPKLTVVPLPYLDGSGALVGKYVTVNKFAMVDAQGNPQGAIDLKSQGGNFVLDPASKQFDQTMMYFHVNRMHDYFKNSFGYTKREGNIPAYVGAVNPDGSALNNAFFSPQCDCIEFGFTDSGLDFALDGDVIGHEFTHSVVNTLNKITNNERWTESRAMNEALADYFSATVSGDGCMGEYITGKTDGSCGRDLTNRRHYPEEVGESYNLKDGSQIQLFPEEHFTSQIWSGALWDMRRSLGSAVADKIIFNSLPLYPDSAGFSDARIATRTSDQQQNTGAAATIAQIMDNRGVAEQSIATYAQAAQFSPDNQHDFLTGYVNPQGGSFSPEGFLPVFVSGRLYELQGFLHGFTDTKEVSFILTNQANNQVQRFKANLANVQIPGPNGGAMVDVTRFQVQIKVPAGGEGGYAMGFAESPDGTNFNLPVAVMGQVVKEAGPAANPPKDVISTPQPVPTSIPAPPPAPGPAAQAASVQVQPAQSIASVGDEIRYLATVVDTTGQAAPGAAVTWSIEGPAGLAAISPAGILSAHRAGQVTVVARIGAVEGRGALTINPTAAPVNVSSWRQVPGSEKGLVLSLAGAAANGLEAIYEAGLDDVRISVNGAPFQAISNGLDSRTLPTSITANPTSPGLVYLATLNFGLFRSTDGGQTWQQYAQDLVDALGAFGLFPEIMSVATDPQDEIAIGTADQGTYARLGTQQPWLDISAGLSTALIDSFVLNPSGTALYAGSNNGAFRIQTGAPTWSAIDNGLTTTGFENQNLGLPPAVNQIALNPQNEKELLAATGSDGVFLTENAGDTWSQISTGLTDPSVLTVVFDPANPNRLFTGTANSGVFVSTDHGKSWQSAAAGLPIGTITSLLFDPANPGRLYAATFGEGVWQLDLGGNIVSGIPSGTPGSAPLPGDVNGDGKVTVQDATIALQIVVGSIVPSATQKQAADLNGDGTVDIRDVTGILRKAVGL